jgi:MscS family membrane protein
MENWTEVVGAAGGGRFLQSAVIFAVAVAAAWIVDRVLLRWVARLARRTATELDDRLVALLRRPLRASILITGLVLVTLRIDPSSLLDGGALRLTALTLDLLATIAILLWTIAGVRAARVIVGSLSGRSRYFDPRTAPLYRNAANFVLVAAATYFVFLTWGINVTAWLASAGILGIALGFAARDSLANFFAGFFILTDAPYKVGDYVNLDSGERGQVTEVGLRSTRILTRDDIEITIPNSIMANAKIANESTGRWQKQRLRVAVSAAYGSDIDRVRAALLRAAASVPDVCGEPAPRVRFRAFGDSGLQLELLAWVDNPADRGRVADALHTAVYKSFAAEGIEIPFPKRDVYLREPASPPAESGAS